MCRSQSKEIGLEILTRNCQQITKLFTAPNAALLLPGIPVWYLILDISFTLHNTPEFQGTCSRVMGNTLGATTFKNHLHCSLRIQCCVVIPDCGKTTVTLTVAVHYHYTSLVLLVKLQRKTTILLLKYMLTWRYINYSVRFT